MYEQVTISELMARVEPPEMWECMKTCVHAGGPWDDYFPYTKVKRCKYPIMQPGYGTSGKHIRSKTINNIWHCWCVMYKNKYEGG